jgi:HTH-type transcriptional regulator/antitoxin HigA
LFGNDFVSAWSRLTRDIPLSRIRSRKQYDLVVHALEYISDLVNDDPRHPLVGLLETLEVLVEDYDREHHQIPMVSGAELLRNLMIEQGLKQVDLADIGSQGVVSEILSGKRRINKRHAGLLAKRFSLPAELFTRA